MTPAFVLTLLAGLWTWGIGGMRYGMGMVGGHGPGSMMWGTGVLGGTFPMSGSPLQGFGLLAGAVLLIGAVFLGTRRGQARRWGLVIILVSVLNLMVGAGGLVAGGMGIVGGALAMSE